MRHAASKDLFRYWETLRGSRPAPERGEIEPAEIRGILKGKLSTIRHVLKEQMEAYSEALEFEKAEVIRAAESDKYFNALAFPEAGAGRAIRVPSQPAVDPATPTRDGD